MEENLAHVGSIVGNLKSMVIDMRNEIDTQKDQMERVQGKVRPPTTRRHRGNHPSSPRDWTPQPLDLPLRLGRRTPPLT